MKRFRFFISGRVQGVCFRAETALRAKILRLKGFAKNLEDGRVEVVAEGDQSKINKLRNWIKRGPAFAKVESVQVVEEKYKGDYKDFKVVY